MNGHRPHSDPLRHIPILRVIVKDRDGREDETEHRNQNPVVLDTSHHAHHSISGILQRSQSVGVKFGYAKAIENLLAHFSTPSFRKLRSQQIPKLGRAQINSARVCHLVGFSRSLVAKLQQCSISGQIHFLSSQTYRANPAPVNATTPIHNVQSIMSAAESSAGVKRGSCRMSPPSLAAAAYSFVRAA